LKLKLRIVPRIMQSFKHLNLVVLSLACLWMAAFASTAQATEPPQSEAPAIRYEIDFPETKNHYLHVTARFETNQANTELMMATWAPGSYLIREYARHVDSMTMTDQDGNPVAFEKTKKNRWKVKTKGVQSVVLKYRLYCNEMTVRTNWTGKAYTMINGAPTFITLVDAREKQHVVKLNLPKRWKRSACALDNPNGPHEYTANTYDELVDNPIVAGNVQVYPFDVDGVPHQLVNVGESGYWDGVKAAADLKKMVAAQHEIWGNVQDWLSLASHEFFHTWNVRRLRPKSLVRYDYENEVYTRSLWIAEGITSYYEDLALVRSGLITRKEFLKRLSETVENVQTQEGRKVQSLTESSYDTWIKFYRSDENSAHTRISYYRKGTVAAFLLDAKIRKTTKGKRSLDDVMREMYEKYSESGYSPQDFRDTASEVAGADLSEWFVKAIDSTDELDFSQVNVDSKSKADSKNKSDQKSDTTKKKQKADKKSKSGLKQDDAQQPKADEAKPNPKPWVIQTDDELLAVNDFRLNGRIASRLEQFEVGETLEFLLSRRGELLRIDVTPTAESKFDWKLGFLKNPNKRQQKALKSWLGD